ncbi:LrgB family protein [Priestia megaterium]|uniref:LrgB family protein n=1 Tax=Priestia megaterium TaxID=1404 RepID=UPI00244935E2|nr:LrgB family protein [Priestia megaterium]MDH2453675.1 LrgB family protein [Priestia megaterium]MDL5153132.1 LrgB family protein [Priestia megaterium]
MTLLTWIALPLTLLVYVGTKVLYKKYKSMLVSPILLAPILLIGILLVTNGSYDHYKQGASAISFMLGPATVAFAVPMFKYFDLLKKHRVEISLSVGLGTFAAMISSMLLALVFHLQSTLVHSLIPRSVTIPIAVNVSQKLGGDPNITIMFVIITGVVGCMVAPKLIKLLALHSSLARGLLLGVASHGTGTARAFEFGKIEGTFSSLGMIVAALLTMLFANMHLPTIFA